MYSFSNLKMSDVSQLTTLLDVCFGIKHVDKQKPITWKFFSSTPIRNVYAWVAKNVENTIISFYSNRVVSVQYGKVRYKAAQCLDMATHPEHRRKGLVLSLAKKVYEEVLHDGFDFSFGFSNQQGVQVDSNASGYGYLVVGQLKQFFLFTFWPRHSECVLKKVSQFERKVKSSDELLQIEPSQEYLTWRYIEKPGSNYEIYEVWLHNRFRGYVVLKCNTFMCSVFKIAVDSQDLYVQVLRAVQRMVVRKGILIVTVSLLPNTNSQRALYGFCKLTYSKKKYFLTVKQHSDSHISKDTLFCMQNWFVMGGDVI